MGWLSGWTYRKKITIAGATGAGTNYQVLLKIGESSGASGYNFHLEGTSASFPSGKNSGGDLRFTSSDGSTLLDFWVETVTGSSPNRIAYVWVEVADDLGSNRDIYCYFGNSSASNASNGANTFLGFRDFDSTSETLTYYGIGSWQIDAANSLLRWTPTGRGGGFATIDVSMANVRVLIRGRMATQGAIAVVARCSDANNYYLTALNSDVNQRTIEKIVNGSWACIIYASETLSLNTFYRLLFKVYGSSLYANYYTDDYSALTPLSTSDSNLTGTQHGIDAWAPAQSSYQFDFDYVAIAKSNSTEPAFSSVGALETLNLGAMLLMFLS